MGKPLIVSDVAAHSLKLIDCSATKASNLESKSADKVREGTAILSVIVVRSRAALRQCTCDGCYEEIRL